MHRKPSDKRDAHLPGTHQFDTAAVKAGSQQDPVHGSLNAPLYLSASFEWQSATNSGGYDYSRTANPTRTALEQALAELEQGKYCFTHSTGMASVTAVAHLLKAGDHVIVGEDCYGGTFRLFNDQLSRFGIEVSFLNLRDLPALETSIRPNTRMIWTESPSNPLLRLVDIRALSTIAESGNAWLVVDNTFCSPLIQNPLQLGAHIVVHSLTKYINGHCDVLGGAVITSDGVIAEEIGRISNTLGISAAAFDSWMILRGVKTLAVRFRHQEKTAVAVARYLDTHPQVKTIHYPGLPGHPDHQLARSQQKGFGAVISFEVDGGMKAARELADSTQVCTLAESLGGVNTLIEIPAFHSHASMTAKARESAGIRDGLIRLSIGLEDSEDIITDLSNALDAIREMSIHEITAHSQDSEVHFVPETVLG